MTPTREQIIEWARAVGWEVHPRKEQVRVGADALAGLDSTPKVERFAALVSAAAYAKGQEDMRDTIMDEWDSCIQSDLEHGVKSLNEKAAAEWRKVYPAMADFSNAVRALPIQKGGGT